LTNVYSRSTFTTISNLPIKDYQLLMKRVEEMVTAGRNLTYQTNIITDNTPGT
jgi:protein gp37